MNNKPEETGHFSEKELNEILKSFDQEKNPLTSEQLEKIQKAWEKVTRTNLYSRQ